MYINDQDRFFRENLDFSDRYTCHYVATLEDAGKEELLSALSSALYDKIVAKVDDIDFGTIPLSRGDITKVQNWDQTEECLNIMRNLVMQYKQSPAIVDVVITAAQNIKDRKGEFVRAYAVDAEFPMLIYNLIVLSIERSVSLMIATCIQFIKDPSSNTPVQALDKVAYQKTMDDMLFKQLVTFNNQCKNGTIDKSIKDVLNKSRNFKEEFDMINQVVSPVQDDPNTSTPDVPVSSQDIEGSPFEPGNTTDPFGGNSDQNPSEVNPDELPAKPGEFPEDVPGDNAPVENPTDDVEPDNIPAVVPGDDVTSNDAPINEDPVSEVGLADLPKVSLSNAPKEVKIGLGVAAAIAGAGLLAYNANHILDWVRNIIYYTYYTEMKFSDYLAVQADLMEANADKLEDSMDSDSKKTEKTIRKQRKLAEKLRKWSNKFNIDRKEAEKKAKKEAAEDKKHKSKVKKDEEGDDVLF